MKKPVYRALGVLAVLLGIAGIFLPLLPTTPFLLLAAFFFARSHPEWEARLLAHPRTGPAILAWRDRRAIPLAAKRAATLLMAISVAGAWLTLAEPWRFLPAAIAVAVLGWIWTRPSA